MELNGKIKAGENQVNRSCHVYYVEECVQCTLLCLYCLKGRKNALKLLLAARMEHPELLADQMRREVEPISEVRSTLQFHFSQIFRKRVGLFTFLIRFYVKKMHISNWLQAKPAVWVWTQSLETTFLAHRKNNLLGITEVLGRNASY